jgi:hypothetical protein
MVRTGCKAVRWRGMYVLHGRRSHPAGRGQASLGSADKKKKGGQSREPENRKKEPEKREAVPGHEPKTTTRETRSGPRPRVKEDNTESTGDREAPKATRQRSRH